MKNSGNKIIDEAKYQHLDENTTKWLLYRYSNITSIYCFGESNKERGGDDKSFYTKYIKNYFNNYNVWFKSAGSKNDVYNTYQGLKNSGIDKDKNIFLFFVDKDWSEFATKGTNHNEIWNNKEIFKTDYYSIENYFLNKKILKPLIEIYKTDKINEIDIIEQNFENDYKKFCNWLLLFMTLYSFGHKKLKKIDISQFYNIYYPDSKPKQKNNKVLCNFLNQPDILKNENNSCSENLIKITKKANFEDAKNEFLKRYKTLYKIENINTVIRGKQTLDFLFKYLNINIDKKNKIKILSLIYHNTCEIPQNLEKYLEDNLKKLKKWQN